MYRLLDLLVSLCAKLRAIITMKAAFVTSKMLFVHGVSKKMLYMDLVLCRIDF